jgi:hypothetical protein
MEEHERQLVVAQLAASQARLLELVDGLTAEQWTFRPAEGRWSIGECLEHVMRVENRLLGVIGKKLEEEPVAHDRARVDDLLVAQAIPDRTVRRQAPEPVRPTSQWPDSAELLGRVPQNAPAHNGFRRHHARRSAQLLCSTHGFG